MGYDLDTGVENVLAGQISEMLCYSVSGSRYNPRRYMAMEAGNMSECRWCDFKDHPYKGGREGTIILGKTEQVPNQFGGTQPHTQPNIKEICPECAAEIGLNDDYTAPVSPAERKLAIEKALKHGA
jgi:hypothetical protein